MAVTVSLYDEFKNQLLNSNVDLDGDTIKIILLNSSGTFTAANTLYSDVSANELSTANGYTNTGQALTTKTVSQTSGTAKWTFDNPTWTASGGSIAAANAIIYSTTNSNKLIAHIAFGATSTAGDGTQFIITISGSGFLTLT